MLGPTLEGPVLYQHTVLLGPEDVLELVTAYLIGLPWRPEMVRPILVENVPLTVYQAQAPVVMRFGMDIKY